MTGKQVTVLQQLLSERNQDKGQDNRSQVSNTEPSQREALVLAITP